LIFRPQAGDDASGRAGRSPASGPIPDPFLLAGHASMNLLKIGDTIINVDRVTSFHFITGILRRPGEDKGQIVRTGITIRFDGGTHLDFHDDKLPDALEDWIRSDGNKFDSLKS
jgi:hypothetical protein